MISAEQFIAILEQKDLLPTEILARLRSQVARSDKPISAELVAKRLIEKGYLTPAIAKRLLAEKPPGKTAPPPANKTPPAEEEPLGLVPLDDEEEDDLGLIPLDDEPETPQAADDLELEELDLSVLDEKPEVPGKTPPPPPKPTQTPASSKAEKKPAASKPGNAAKPPPLPPSRPPAKPTTSSASGPGSSRPADQERLIPLDDDLAPADVNPLDGLLNEAVGSPTSPAAKPIRGLVDPASSAKKKAKGNVWDSTLLLVGGGTLLGLLLLGGVLYWALSRQGGDQMLAQADQDYLAGSYTQAIHKYSLYLKKFPEHSGASRARVRRGLAQLRQATEGTSDWPRALATAHEVLEEIAKEESFKTEAQKELLALLPTIAEGLARAAHQTKDPALVAQTRDALALVERHIPHSMRPATKLADIRALLELTEREIARSDELKKAIAAMLAAVKEGETEEAYRVRDALLEQYPSLIQDEKLRAAILEVSRKAQSAVKNVEHRQEPLREDPSRKVTASVVLASRTTSSAPPGAEGHVVFVKADGAVYGLEGATGKVLWRRPVGFQTNGRSPSIAPIPVADTPGSDVILVDTGEDRHDVLRVEAATGKLRWRFPVGERFDAQPVVADDRLLVATRSGRLVSIDLESGVSSGYVELPQGLDVAPCVDVARSAIYQLAEHSNLFVLPLDGPGVKQVVYLGHERRSITAPPIRISRFLIVAENQRADNAVLKVYTLEALDDLPAFSLLQEVHLEGHVDTPPLAAGVRMLAATDRGNLYVFELTASDPKKPLVQLGEGKAAAETGAAASRGDTTYIAYPLLLESRVFVADSQLTCYDLQAARGRLRPKGIQNERTAAVQPLVALGKSVIHAYRRQGLPGVAVSAMGLEVGQRFWETHLAAPLLGEPAIDAASGRITAVTSVGGVFQVDGEEIRASTMLDQPLAALPTAELHRPVSDVVRWENGLLALATVDGPKEVQVIRPQAGSAAFRSIALPDRLGGRPIAFADGLLAPCKIGQVFLLDPQSGAKRTEPFQPRLESGAELAWRKPAAVGDREFVLADNRANLYYVGIQEEPKLHLAMLATKTAREQIVSPLAVLGSVVYAVDASNVLSAYGLPGLTPDEQWPLDGRSVWGPQRVGGHVLLVVDDQKAADPSQARYKLYCLDGDKKLVWQVPMPSGPLAGMPLALGEKYVLTSTDGRVWTIEAATGKTLAEIDLGQPLATGPVPFGEELLVGGHDGTLYQFKQP